MEAQRRERQRLLTSADRDEVLLGPQHEAPEGGAIGLGHHLRQQPVGAHGAVGLAGRDQVVRVVEVDRVDLVERHERLDLDRPRLLRVGGAQLRIGDDDLLAVELVGVADVLVGDLLLVLRADAAGLDGHVIGGVQLAEVQVEVAHRAGQADRHVDEAEVQRARPQRPRHLVSRVRISLTPTGRLAAPGGRRRSRTYTRYAPDHRRTQPRRSGPAMRERTSGARH